MTVSTVGADFVRVSKLAEVFPVFTQRTWEKRVAAGRVPSHKMPDGRARIVRVSDVVAYLSGNAEPTLAPAE